MCNIMCEHLGIKWTGVMVQLQLQEQPLNLEMLMLLTTILAILIFTQW